MMELLELRSSKTGSSRAPLMPKAARDGPMPRSKSGFDSFPWIMNPAIIARSPVSTRRRVEMLSDWAGAGVGDEAMTMLVQVSSLSTIAQPVPEELLVEVKVEFATPVVMVPVGGAIVPWVALHATAVSGSVPKLVVSCVAELSVMSAVTVELSNALIGFGEALTFSTSHGSASTVPVTPSQPAGLIPPTPGPSLQPHQLFSALA